MADNILSPNRAAQRMLKYRAAVMTVARYRAKKAVQAQIRARGLKIAQFTSRQVAELAEAYMAQHMEELITKATADCLTFPEALTRQSLCRC
jgi:hypothetical protein